MATLRRPAPNRRRAAVTFVLLGLLLLAGGTANAQASEPVKQGGGAGQWLRERFLAEWLIGTGGWRTAVVSTSDAPGFEAFAGGTELTLGFDLKPGIGLVANGRALVGRHAKQLYLDAKGGLAVQIQASLRVRVRIGLTAGQLRDGSVRAISFGGFVAMGVDLVQFRDGRSALMFGARLDVDGHTGAPPSIPGATLALAVGLGLRY